MKERRREVTTRDWSNVFEQILLLMLVNKFYCLHAALLAGFAADGDLQVGSAVHGVEVELLCASTLPRIAGT